MDITSFCDYVTRLSDQVKKINKLKSRATKQGVIYEKTICTNDS